MKFKDPSLEIEFARAIPEVIAAAFYFDYISLKWFHIEGYVTDVDRTQDEYDAIYANEIRQGQFYTGTDGKNHYAGPRPHLVDQQRNLYSRAVDFRSAGYTGDQQRRLLDHFNASWRRADKKPTLLHHHVGQHGEHFHLQMEDR